MPLGDELRRALLANPEQHLQLVLIRIHPRNPRERTLDEPLVVRRHADIASGLEKRVEYVEEALPNLVTPLIRNW